MTGHDKDLSIAFFKKIDIFRPGKLIISGQYEGIDLSNTFGYKIQIIPNMIGIAMTGPEYPLGQVAFSLQDHIKLLEEIDTLRNKNCTGIIIELYNSTEEPQFLFMPKPLSTTSQASLK